MIENQIIINKNELFKAEPPQGHREKFAMKLYRNKKRKKMVTIIGLVAAASVAIAIFVFRFENKNPLIEVQNYYCGILEEEIDKTKEMLKYIDEDDKQIIFQDLQIMKTQNNISEKMTNEDKLAYITLIFSEKIQQIQQIQDNILYSNFN